MEGLDGAVSLLETVGRFLVHSPDGYGGAAALLVDHILSLVAPLLQHGSDPVQLLRLAGDVATRNRKVWDMDCDWLSGSCFMHK